MATIQGVYLALFGRPADPLGLAFFNGVTNNGTNLAAIGPLQSSAEYTSRFTGQSNVQIINSIYQALFNRDADLPGLTFFANALQNGTLSIANIAIAIYDGAQGADKTIRDLKEAAANAFTTAIDTAAEVVGYNGNNAAASARAFISGITTTAPTAAQIDAAVSAAVSLGGNTPAQTFTLTTNADGPGALSPAINTTGSAGNDVYNGVNGSVNTLTAADQIDGGAGTDTLNLILDANGSVAALNGVTNVEIFNIRDLADGTTIDFGTVSGETQVWNDRGTGPLALNNLAAGTTVGLRGDGGTVLGAVNFEYAAAATAVSIAVDGGVGATGAAPAVTNGGVNGGQVSNPTAATITSTGASNTLGIVDLTETAGGASAGINSLTVNATTNLTATLVNVDYNTGGADLKVSGAATSVNLGNNGVFKTIDASGMTVGGLTVGLNAVTTSFKGGTGNDVVTTAGLGAAVTASAINAGAGTADRIVVGASTDVDSAAKAQLYAGFEVLDVVNNTANASQFTNSTITALRVAGGTINGVSAAQATAITQYANGSSTIAVTGATTVGQIDSVKITADDGSTNVNTINLGTPTLAGVEQLELVATDNIQVGALTAATSLNKLTLSGAGTISVTSGAITPQVNTVIDGSAATGALTIDLGAVAGGATTNAVSVTGGTKGDTIIATGGAADLINGKAGIDLVTVTKDGASSGFATVQSEALVVADADLIAGFVTTENKFDYNGALANGTGTSSNGIQAAEVVTGATLAAGLADLATANNAIVFIAQTNVADGGGNTQGTAFTVLIGSTIANAATNYAALEAQLLATGGALNGNIANLDTVISGTDSALLVLDNGTGSVVLRITNSDTAVANTLTAAEVELVGVFTTTAALATADFV